MAFSHVLCRGPDVLHLVMRFLQLAFEKKNNPPKKQHFLDTVELRRLIPGDA